MGAERIIYMDYSATTPVKPAVMDAMIPCFTEHSGNPSSICSIARGSKKAIDASRAQTAEAPGGLPTVRVHCPVPADEGIHRAIHDYRVKQGLEPWAGKNPHTHEHEDLTCRHEGRTPAPAGIMVKNVF